ncbi:hypothetical protein CWC29_014375 [Pseudoalteromonas sp. S4498]|uniref:Uncharacterized protein n=1 Tax=Pseudoalteromonas galatheae TaxID=579562 RepID=A0A8T6YUF0_9GAMM|nr:hypothetical protein [Pseudoalteromonas galatheae]
MAVYPKTPVQLCIVHQIGHSLCYVNWKKQCVICNYDSMACSHRIIVAIRGCIKT